MIMVWAQVCLGTFLDPRLPLMHYRLLEGQHFKESRDFSSCPDRRDSEAARSYRFRIGWR